MNRLAKNRSTAFLILSWFFVATLFADGANLDDLIPGNVVMHDDEDAVSPPASGIDATQFSCTPVQRSNHLHLRLPAKRTRPFSAPGSLRVIVDQDSPSLAPEFESAALLATALAAGTQASLERTSLSCDDIYLRLCTLLM